MKNFLECAVHFVRLSFNFHLKLVKWNSSCRATDWILILGVRLTVCGSKEIQVGLAILKSSILYIFWGARKPRNGFEQSLFKCGCAQNVLFDFSPVVKVHQVVSCAAAIFKKQVVLGLSVCRALSSFSHLPLTQRLWCTSLNFKELRSSKKT